MESLKGRDFLRVADWSADELLALLDLADRLKDERKRYVDEPLLPGRSFGLLLEKPSLRTRVSFELAAYQLGGHAVHLTGPEVGLGQREPIRDMAYVMSRFLDAIIIRTFAQATVEELAEHAYIPVVNGLTDEFHPCQALADVMTIRERLGGLEGVRVAWLGDGNNVCASLAELSGKLGMDFTAAAPEGYELENLPTLRDPREAARAAPTSSSRTRGRAWARRKSRERRRRDFEGYQVDAQLLGARRPGRDRAALPPRPSGRGDHRGRPLRPAVRGVGRSREQAAHREGPARARGEVVALPLRDNVPTRSFPVVTVALIAINAAVWLLYQLPNLDRSLQDLAFHPCEVNSSCPAGFHGDKGWLLTALTSMFMHASWLHIAGNMLFLWIFGNNVEDAMGRFRFSSSTCWAASRPRRCRRW